MKGFLTKVKSWFVAHKPTKRRLIQLYAALLTNANIKGFFSGKIYTGDTKNLCAPGLNCYSCPGAVGACPLGALQDSLAQSGKTAPFYIIGILFLFGLMFARFICGFLCPFGLIQELLYKIRTPKLRKSRFTRILSYFKYVLLGIVIAIPIIYAGIPSFCKYICPAGTVEGAVSLLANVKNSDFYGMLAYLFTWKFCVLVVVVVACIFIYRFFCRFICPLGAIYSLFNRISLIGVKLDKEKCIDCGLCIQGCKMDIKHVGDHECIQCGECISVCPVQAISWKGSKIFVKGTSQEEAVLAEGEKAPLLDAAKSNASVTLAAPADGIVAAETLSPSETDTFEIEKHEQEEQKQEKPLRRQAIKAAFKKPRFLAEFVAWVVALAVLLAALICYNLPEKKAATMPHLTLSTYVSAASDGQSEYKTDGEERTIKVLYFWRTDLEESVAAMAEFNRYATECEYNAEFVAIHSIYKDNRDVQAAIDANGWRDYNIIFAQDDAQNNAYSQFGGDISVAKPIYAVIAPDGRVVKTETAVPTAEDMTAAIVQAQRTTAYRVGDLCPIFELKCYNPEEEGHTFSILESRGKVTVINFWYTTCDPCKDELPEFEEVFVEYGGAINMVAIHSLAAIPADGVQNFLDTASDKNQKPWNSYTLSFAQDTIEIGVANMLDIKTTFPTTIILDAEGRIVFKNFSKCSKGDLVAAIESAMNK